MEECHDPLQPGTAGHPCLCRQSSIWWRVGQRIRRQGRASTESSAQRGANAIRNSCAGGGRHGDGSRVARASGAPWLGWLGPRWLGSRWLGPRRLGLGPCWLGWLGLGPPRLGWRGRGGLGRGGWGLGGLGLGLARLWHRLLLPVLRLACLQLWLLPPREHRLELPDLVLVVLIQVSSDCPAQSRAGQLSSYTRGDRDANAGVLERRGHRRVQSGYPSR